MVRIISIVFIFLMVIGCSGAKEEKAKIDQKRSARSEQWVKNIMSEDIKLLAVKYDIGEEQLIKILNEYEKMTKGFSITELISTKKENIKTKVSFEEVIDVTDALNRLGDKYHISKQILSSIIIENKIIKRGKESD
jgi:hypothetical protein